MRTCAAVLCIAMCVAAAFSAEKVVERPQPEQKTKFDHTRIDRSLKEPEQGQAKPAYRFLAFGPEGKFVVSMVAVETKAGTGVDTLYLDLNGNHDVTEPAERFAIEKPRPMKKVGRGHDDLVLVSLSPWGVTLVPSRKLGVADPKLDYVLSVSHSFVLVHTTTKDKSWGFPMRVMDGSAPWSLVKDRAPVIRFGGPELTFANDNFARRAGPSRRAAVVDPGKPVKTLKPGDNIYVDGTAPFFAGSSPEVGLGQSAGVYCPWTDRNIQARIEAGSGADRRVVHLPFYRSCGGAYWASVLVSAGYPHGDGALVLSMDTGGYLGKVVKRIPFKVDNPLYGKPVAELAATQKLREKHKGAAVLVIYQGMALPKLGVPSYDGARDVYFGDGRPDRGFSGSCQNRGTGLSYGTELRYRLDLGGEDRRSLIKFDLSMLDGRTKVRQAVLALNVLRLNRRADVTCRAVALKKRWSEIVIGEWGGLNGAKGKNPGKPRRRRYPVGDVESWEQPAFAGESDRHAEPVGQVIIRKTGWVTVDITPAARNWLAGKWPNHGLALETVERRWEYGKQDVAMASSEYSADPRLRPRLILVLDGEPKPRGHKVEQRSADFKAAVDRACAEKKLLLINVLSAGSLTSRSFETRVLKGVPAVGEYIDRNFVEARIDADDPSHKLLLARFGVRRFPTAVIAAPKPAGTSSFVLVEPFEWDAMFGLQRSGFEFEQLYTRELSRVLARHAKTGSVRPSGKEIGGCGAP